MKQPFCRERELNPHGLVCPRDFKSLASAYSAIPADYLRGWPESNRRIKVLQTSALPLGYIPNGYILYTDFTFLSNLYSYS